MSIPRDLLLDFAGALASATSAPDRYPLPEYMSYEQNMADIKSFWATIKPQIQRDIEKSKFIDQKLQEMFAAFDAGENEKGLDAVMAIYNSDVKKLR